MIRACTTLGQFPIAAANHFGQVHNTPDLITAKLPALHLYQLSIPAPAPPSSSFDHVAPDRGRELFSGKAQCSTCHIESVFTEPGSRARSCVQDYPSKRSVDPHQGRLLSRWSLRGTGRCLQAGGELR
jgi:hypothetical protein